jgi:phage gp29-like protein
MARTPRLLDQWGNPIETGILTQEIAAPTLGGIRNVWTETVISGLTPVSMAEMLRQAGRGYPDRFFVLAEEMEERDLHYGSVLGTRKRAITGIEPIVVAASPAVADEKIAAAVREMIAVPGFVDDYLADLLDALGKGYSVIETIWDRQARQWWPERFAWRDPGHFQIDQIDGRTIRLKDSSHRDGIDLPPFKFSVHRPKLKSGLPIRGGLARLAAWTFLFKSYTLKDWMAFLEVYGMPLRVGRFGKSASHDDRRVLLQAVRGIATDAAAIIPKEMEIEFIEVSGGTGNGLFSAKAEYLDKQVSKGVLGQTMSTDDGASLSQAKIHENVRYDIAKADARQTAVTVNRDLIRPFVDLNFGPQQKYPTFVIQVTENEDIKALADVVSRLVNHGLEVSMAKVRQRVGFDEPEEGEKILHPARKPEPEAEDPPATKPARAGALRCACPHCGGLQALAADQRDELDMLVDAGLEHWQADLEPLLKPLRALFERATSYAEIEAGLEDIAAKMDGGPLADRLAKLAMIARGLGDIGEGRA